MSVLFLVISGALFILSVYGGTNTGIDVSANATRVLIASGIFAIAGVLT